MNIENKTNKENRSLVDLYWKPIVIVFIAFVVGGGTTVFLNNHSMDKEKKAQEAYFAAEKNLNEFLYKNDDAANGAKKGLTDKITIEKAKADFQNVINNFPKSIAAQMAALNLAKLSIQDNKNEEALSLLQKVENQDVGLINTLVQQQIGQLLADQSKCSDAIAIWQKILNKKEAAFIHDEVQIQQALCYSKNNDFKKAEEILTNLANKVANPEMGLSNTSKEAEKYLRLIQFKKASGT